LVYSCFRFTSSIQKEVRLCVRMVLCAVYGCSKRSGRDKNVSFYRLPAVNRPRRNTQKQRKAYELRLKRRAGYLAAIGRKNIPKSLKNWRVCSRHFLSRKPASLYDVNNPDWLPTLHLGKEPTADNTAANKSQSSGERYKRAKGRTEKRKYIEQLVQLLPNILNELIYDLCEEEVKDVAAEQIRIGMQYIDVARAKEPTVCECSTKVKVLQEQLLQARLTIQSLMQQLGDNPLPFCEDAFIDDEFTRYHTGLPNRKVLLCLFEHVSVGMTHERETKLTLFQQFACVLLKLRTNADIENLSHRFGVSSATISRILNKWLPHIDKRLCGLILWPDREALQKTMPQSFQRSFGKKVAVILDCFEIFIERPSNLRARASTWSNYKHHNTAKVLLGITPQGVISFVSECWGGRVSDVHLTEHSGILKKLLPGDVVLADRGFDIADSVSAMQAKLHIPAFTKNKNQLSALEVEETRKIANVRIHVERVIGSVKQKFKILQNTIPIQFVTKQKDQNTPLIDHIVRVCCELTNVCDSVVPFD